MGKNRKPRKDQPSASQATASQGGGPNREVTAGSGRETAPAPTPPTVSSASSSTPAVRSAGHPGQYASAARPSANPGPLASAARPSAYPGTPASAARPTAYPGPPASAARPTAYPGPPAAAARPSAYPGLPASAARPSAYPGPVASAARPSASPGPTSSAVRPYTNPGPPASAAGPSTYSGPPASSQRPSVAGPSAPGLAIVPTAAMANIQITTPALVQVPPSSSKALALPRRPGYGTAGRKCMIRANHFLVEVSDKNYFQYDISITPEVTSKLFNRKIIKRLVDVYRVSDLGGRTPAYDGKKIFYTAGPLPFESKEFLIKDIEDESSSSKQSNPNRKDRQFKVVIKYASKGDLHHLQQYLQGRQLDCPQEVIQVLDVVLRAGPSISNTVVGRHFVNPMGKGSLGDGVEYWRGHYQSLRPTQIGLSLNIDLTARSFYESIFVPDFIVTQFNFRDLSRPLSDHDRVKVKKALRGVKVEISHREYSRSYKVSGISQQPADQLMFTLDDQKTKTSVVQYFSQKYGIKLKYPRLPAIQAGSDTKPIYLPMELCKIAAGQRYTKKLNQRQVTNLLNATCIRPSDRERDIGKMVANNNYNEDIFNKEFGISVKKEFALIEARVLPPPMLKYHQTGRESTVNPQMGQWNMINKKMVNGARVGAWTCISFSTRLDKDFPHEFCGQLLDMCRSKGVEFNPQPLVPVRCEDSRHIERALQDIHKESLHTQKQLQLLIIILPDISGSYGKIKRICETELGIVSQCCNPKQAVKFSKQYFENLALKINVKVGGRNTVLNDAINKRIPLVTDMPTMIFGADVTHPMPGDDSSPSIAAVVASMDWPEITKYRCLVSAQTHRDEIIEDLYRESRNQQGTLVAGGMIRDLLIAFRRSTNLKPARIIFYRDGVSEGQFSQVLLHEMDKIRKACNSLEAGYLPKVTFVVVQKRHHTRFFPENHSNRNATDRSGNVLPGTVVDTKICHPSEFDFYLNSHAGIKGTSRPAHYHVLYDENKFSADQLQTLTNDLCYTYARCTRAVSIVPPAYYAHLAAFRARSYLDESSDAGSSSGVRGGVTAAVKQLPAIKDNVKDVMFYC